MAASDYRSCDVCGAKTFYDANLDYEKPDADHGNEWWLHGVGDWVVICPKCAETKVCVVMDRADLTAPAA